MDADEAYKRARAAGVYGCPGVREWSAARLKREAGVRTTSRALFEDYAAFQLERKQFVGSQRALSNWLVENKYTVVRLTAGVRAFDGAVLR